MSSENVAPEDVLDSFLFGDVWNNQNYFEDDWAITFMGDEYLLLKRATGETFNIRVAFVPGSLTEQEKTQLAADQEWFWDEEDDE